MEVAALLLPEIAIVSRVVKVDISLPGNSDLSDDIRQVNSNINGKCPQSKMKKMWPRSSTTQASFHHQATTMISPQPCQVFT